MTDRSKPLAWLAAGALFALPAGMIGCGSDNNNDGGSTAASTTASTTAAAGGGGGAGGAIDVSETDFALNPADPSVSAGNVTINATNDGQTEHAIEVEGPNGEQKSDPIAPGEKTSLTVDFSKPGTYEWYCPIDSHKDMGMKGEITVK
jgi:plastocyanin